MTVTVLAFMASRFGGVHVPSDVRPGPLLRSRSGHHARYDNRREKSRQERHRSVSKDTRDALYPRAAKIRAKCGDVEAARISWGSARR